MKSEHRHDLKTNELGRLAARIGPFFETHGNRILLGMCGLIVVAAGVVIWSRTAAATASNASTQFAAATNPEELAGVAENYQGTEIGAWARLLEAEGHLGTGIQLMFTDRKAAISDLEQARESFQKALADASASEDVRERALFGMARCLESLADSNTDPAVEAYERLVREFPETVYQETAETRIASLKTQEAKEFYAWFSAQQPKPDDLELPQDGTTPEIRDVSEPAATNKTGIDEGPRLIPLEKGKRPNQPVTAPKPQ